MIRLQAIVLLFIFAGCGSSIDDKAKFHTPANTAATNNDSNNDANNTTNDTVNDTTGASTCGDGVLDAGELCDPAKSDGSGVCPTSCAAPACATATLVGSASQCTAQCIVEPLACTDGDGCCPAGCDGAVDDDCANQCGDGVVEGPELCDGNCPTQCDDANACTTDSLLGAAAQCSASCHFEPISACVSGDGCCPSGCSSERDNDCAPTQFCGNGVVDPGELCDGACPASCNDGVACTTDRLSGSAATCDAQCTTSPISACVNGDGCCPGGCTSQNDNDCACVPRTCAQAGAQCGTVSNGCGGTLTCTNTCNSIQKCAQNQCVAENFIGADCTDYPQCGSSQDAVCILPPSWPGGYCSILCNGANTLCPTGSHCADFDGVNSLCMLNCTSDAQCEAGYVCGQWDGVGGRECVPPEPPAGSGDVGDACQSSADCNGALTCYQTYTSNNTTYSFPGGVCSQPCVPLLGQCDAGDVCTLDAICMPGCTSNTQCRANYSCTGFGLPGASTYCWP